MTATLPLQSCRMFASGVCLRDCWFGRSGQPVHGDGTRLWTAIEADAATGTVVSGVVSRMHAVVAQLSRKFEALGRAGFNAKPASFALFHVDYDFTARRTRHIVLLACLPRRRSLYRLRSLQPFGLLAVLPQLCAEVRMRDLDQRFGAFANRLAV